MTVSVSESESHRNGRDEEEANQANEPHEKSTWGDDLQELRHRLEMLEQQQHSRGGDIRIEEVVGLLGGKNTSLDDTEGLNTAHTEFDTRNDSTSTIEKNDTLNTSAGIDVFELPESTYSLIIAADICSIPFNSALLALGLALTCLVLTLLNELENKEPGNPWGVPAGLAPEVRFAQYLGIIIGVLMEDEIPTALDIIGKGVEQEMSTTTHVSMPRIVFSSLLRLSVGYLFLICLFLVVVQESTVLGIFFDVLALEFVENIDDVAFALFRRGFFGRNLRRATTNLPVIESVKKDSYVLRKWTKRFIRFVFFLNAAIGIALLTHLTMKQDEGGYRCTKIEVAFGDDIWDQAYITNGGGTIETKLLIYSHFNGIYEEEGTHDGRPRYVERNKKQGKAYERVVPAEIVFCKEIGAWVLRHDDIKTSNDGASENPCSWLMKSQSTDSFDIIELGKEPEWFIWKGLIVSKRAISIECNQCQDKSSCNYNGQCLERECICNEDFFGTLCQFTKPCNSIRPAKNYSSTLELLRPSIDDNDQFVESYGRPMYVARNMTGMPYSFLRLGYQGENDEEYSDNEPTFYEDDDFFRENFKKHPDQFKALLENYTFALHYTGMRWHGGLFPPDMNMKVFNDAEYHAFWDNAFSGLGEADNSTFLISEPSFGGSPVGVDFYEMRRRNILYDDDQFEYNYDFFGVIIPLVEYHGAGFYHCNAN